MGKIKKILENELVGGTQGTDVYPVTSVKAVYDENNERLDHILNRRGEVNISTEYNGDHIAEELTLSKAIAKVPTESRVLGFTGKFLSEYGWKTYTFIGTSVSDWSNTSLWRDDSLGKRRISSVVARQNDYIGIIPTNGSVTITGYGFQFMDEIGNTVLTITRSNSGVYAPSIKFDISPRVTYTYLVLDLSKVGNADTIWGGTEDLYLLIENPNNLKEDYLILACWYGGNLISGILYSFLSNIVKSSTFFYPLLSNYPNSIEFQGFGDRPNSSPYQNKESITFKDSMILFLSGTLIKIIFNTPQTLYSIESYINNYYFNINLVNTSSLSTDDEGIPVINITDDNFSDYFTVKSWNYNRDASDSELLLLSSYKGVPMSGVLIPVMDKIFQPITSTLIPSATASKGDSPSQVINGGVKLIGTTVRIKKDTSFYIYLTKLGYGKPISYLLSNTSGEDINIELSTGDTLCIDFSQLKYNANPLELDNTLKIVNYDNFNGYLVPLVTMRQAAPVINPSFIWLFYHAEIAGASSTYWAILGTGATLDFENDVMSVGARSAIFLYKSNHYNNAQFCRLNCPAEGFSINLNDYPSNSTVIIDGSLLEWDSDDININMLPDVIKVVSGRKYNSYDIPIVNKRAGTNASVSPVFSPLMNTRGTGTTDEVFLINKSNFLPYYSSVCRAKRGDLSSSNKWVDRCNILFLTDNHATNTDGYKNIREAIRVANLTNSKVNAIVDTGDLTNGFGTGVPKQSVITTLETVKGILLESSIPVLALLGNHDANDYGGDPALALTKKEQWDAIFEGLSQKWSSVVFGNKETYRHYSYLDLEGDDYGKIRIIMLDQLDHDLPQNGEGKLIYTCQNDPVYSQAQIDWLCNEALQVEDGTGIVICNHYPFDYTPTSDRNQSLIIDGKYVQPWNMIPEIVNAWQNRTTLTKTYEDSVGSQNISVSVDFSNIGSKCEFITYLCGHTHFKTTKVVQGFKQMMLLEDSSGSYGTGYSWTSRLAGTVTSNCFSILSIDRTLKKIFRSNYGAWKTVNEDDAPRIDIIDYVVP